jgi:hypothetical protein
MSVTAVSCFVSVVSALVICADRGECLSTERELDDKDNKGTASIQCRLVPGVRTHRSVKFRVSCKTRFLMI